MSKKQANKQQQPKSSQRKRRSRRQAIMVIGLTLSLGLTSLFLAQWRSLRPSFSTLSPAPQTSPTPRLSKEYIYAGGKLIATEEPTVGGGSSSLSPPSSLIANGTSTPSIQINLSWAASTGGTVDHYQVERCQDFAQDCYFVVAANVPATAPTVNFSDTTNVSAGKAYLYRVRAVDSAGNFSNYSQIDLATTITFTDDPLNPNGTKTIIRAQHLIELRQAVNAVRTLARLSTASWTYADPVSSPPSQRRPIYWEDVAELRSKLDEALTILGRLQPYDSDPPLSRGSPVSAAHFMQIRERVR